jgi:hypothetical protein
VAINTLTEFIPEWGHPTKRLGGVSRKSFNLRVYLISTATSQL